MMKKNIYRLTYIMNRNSSIELDKEENIFTGEDLKNIGIQLDDKLLKEKFFKIIKSETGGVLSWSIVNLLPSGKEIYVNFIKNKTDNSEVCLNKDESHHLKNLLDQKIYLRKANGSWDYFLFEKEIKEVDILKENIKNEKKEDEPMNINFDDFGLLDDLFNEKGDVNCKEKTDPSKIVNSETDPTKITSDKYIITFYKNTKTQKDLEEEEKQRKEIFDDFQLEQLLNEYEQSDDENKKETGICELNSKGSDTDDILSSNGIKETKKPVKKIIIDDEDEQVLDNNQEVCGEKVQQNVQDNKIEKQISNNLNIEYNNIISSCLTPSFKVRPKDHEESITNSEIDRILDYYNNENSYASEKEFINKINCPENTLKLNSQNTNNQNHNKHNNINSNYPNYSNTQNFRVNINIGGKNLSPNTNNGNFMPVINISDYTCSSFKQSNSNINIPYIRSSIKQRRENWQQSTKKFGGEWNSNGKRSSQRSDNDLISAFKSKRLKKATENKELQIELNTTCAICLDTINQLANLDNCSHDFCKPCILQWSKNTNLCPLCKKEFKKIIYYEKNKKKELKVKKRKLEVEEEEALELLDELAEESAENCMVCAGSNDLAHMLVCDGCQYNVCHTYCDGLSAIPESDWFCSTCRGRHYASNMIRNIVRDEDLINEEDDDESYSPRILLEEEDEEEEIQKDEDFKDLGRVIAHEAENLVDRPRRRGRRNNNNNNIRVDIRVNVNMQNRRYTRRRSRGNSSDSNNQALSSNESLSNTFSNGSNMNNNPRNLRARSRSGQD